MVVPLSGLTDSQGTSLGLAQRVPPPPSLSTVTTMVRWKSGKPMAVFVVGSVMPQVALLMKVGWVSGVALAPGKNCPLSEPGVNHSTTRSLATVSLIAPVTGIVTEANEPLTVVVVVPISVSAAVGIVSTGVLDRKSVGEGG